MMEPILHTITLRHSTRAYAEKPIADTLADKLLSAAVCAPSGKNSQPWNFAVIHTKEIISQLARCMGYSRFIATAPCVIAVYKVHARCYDNTKDDMAIGAAIQNLLLCAHAEGLGTCWVGENMEGVSEILSQYYATDGCTLMSLVAVGYPDHTHGEEWYSAPVRNPIYRMRRRENEF